MNRHPERPRRRLFWRVYLHGFVLLVAASVAASLAGWIVAGEPGVHAAWRRIPDYLGDRLTPLVDNPPAMRAELESLHRTFDVDLAVFRADQTLVAAAGRTTLAPESRPPAPEAHRFRDGRLRFSRALGSTGAYLTVRGPAPAPFFRLVVMLAAVLAALALGSIPLARAIALPLERLTETARRLGAGDLTAKSGIARTDEVGLLAAALDDMASQVARLLTSERELLANVSHELKTPLARVRVALALAVETDDASVVRTRLQGIGADLGELEGLIDDALAVARLDLAQDERGAGGFRLRLKEVRLEDVVHDAAAAFAAWFPSHRLDLRLARDLPALTADPVLLRRALQNLLENAGRYAEPGAGPVEVVAAHGAGGVIVEVLDRGIGVSADDLPRLFEPFFRSDKSRDRATGGSGLGLALCRRIVEAHGGVIVAEPRQGGGLGVRLTLAAAAPPHGSDPRGR